MNDYLTALHQDLKENTLKDYRMKDYDKYFEVTETPKRGKKITPKEMRCAMRLEITVTSPCFLMRSMIRLKRWLFISDKDVVEKAFGNLKERLNFRRMQVSSELSLNGKLFVEFIALIYLSYVKKKMQRMPSYLTNGLSKVYWMNWTRLNYSSPPDMDACWERLRRSRRNYMRH